MESVFADFKHKESRVYLFILAVVSLVIYIHAVSFEYTYYDDDLIIISNQKILEAPLDYVKIFTTGAFFDYQSQLYRPLQNLSFLADVSLSEGVYAWMFHLTNILLFALISLLIFVVFNTFSKSRQTTFYFSLLFVVHPLFTSSVVWIPARGDLLLTLFTLFSFVYYLKFINKDDLSSMLMSWLTFTLALFSKETAIVLPLLFIVYFFVFSEKRKLSPKHLLLMLLVLCSISFWYWLRRIATEEFNPDLLIEKFGFTDIFKNFLMIPESLGRLLMPFSFNTLPKYGVISIVLGILILVFLGFLLKKITNKAEDKKTILYFAFWFLLVLMPIIFLTKNYYVNYIEHRFLLPMIGFWVVMMKIFEHFATKKYTALFIMIALIFSIANIIKAKAYNNANSFYQTALSINKDSELAYYTMGNIKKNNGDLYGAIDDYSKAISIDNKYALAYNNRAIVKAQLNDLDGALEDFNIAISLTPDADIYNNRAMVKYLQKDYQGAIADYSEQLKIDDKLIINYYNRGLVYSVIGQHDRAIYDFKKYISIDTTNPKVYYDLGVVYRMKNDYQNAIRCFDKAIALDLVYAEAYNNRAYVKWLNKDYMGALKDCDVLISIHPNDTAAYILRERIDLDLKKKQKK